MKGNVYNMRTKVLAIYLPQFHVIPENNEWWGEGFTEWTNVKRGHPFYRGHYQPREPLNGNYYDLSDLAVLEKHTKMAGKAGIYGFCFYHYYFNGKKLLEKPIENYRDKSNEKFPYCLIWANQSWTRTWYRAKVGDKMLINQEYGNKDDWEKQFYYLLKFFKDERYIKIDGKPVYIIYLPQDIPSRQAMFSLWRTLAVQNGLKGLYLIAMDTFAKNDFRSDLYDAYMNFEPLHVLKNDNSYRKTLFFLKNELINRIDINKSKLLKRLLVKDMYTYSFLCKKIEKSSKKTSKKKTFLGVFSGWDNTPRKDEEGWIAKRSTPRKFGWSIRRGLEESQKRKNEFLFINAWNEWSEGAYIEPDKKYGYAYLNNIKKEIMYFRKSVPKREPVLLITATIFPQENRYVYLKNPKERLRQYIDSVKFYIIKTKIKEIVFCDNSGYAFKKEELFSLADKYHKKLEIIQFVGNQYKIMNYGKGYGEGELIEYALKNSSILHRADYFIKVTGRLKIKNIDEIRGKLDFSKIYFNKNINKQQSIDTVLYCISKETYNKWFLYAYKQVCDKKGRYIEHVFKDIIENNRLHVYNTPYYPYIDGVRGTTGKRYQDYIGKERWIYNILSRFNGINCRLVNTILYKVFVEY